MKKFAGRIVATVTVVALSGLAVPSIASAAGTPKAGTTITGPWAQFHVAWSAYGTGLRTINQNYRNAVESATVAHFQALNEANTAAERQSAGATFRAALEAAITARDLAITAAGNPPTPPAGFNGTAWVTGFESANIAFRASVVAAQGAFVQALAAATTPQARLTARAARDTALAAAWTARSTALNALGPHPTHPGQPL